MAWVITVIRSPRKIILTSVELDHQDYFADYKDIQSAFLDYINLLPQNGVLVYCADDQGAKETAEIAFQKRPDLRLIPYGVTASGDYKVTFGKIDDGKQYFSLAGFDKNFAIKIPGHHIVLDAVAAMALSLELVKEENPGKQFSNEILEQVATGLLNFAGAKRRSEILGEKDNVDSSINLVVYSAAYKLDINPDLIKATELGIPCFL